MTSLTDPPLVLAPAFVDDKGLREGLRKAFPKNQIGQLPKGGVKLDYVGHAAVTHRLNEVAPDWTYRLDPPYRDKEGVIVGVLGYMTIGGKTIPEVGSVEKRMPDGEAMKQCISDFIRRGAMRFGVALDLWSKEDLNSTDAPASVDTPEEPKAGSASKRSVQAPSGGIVGAGEAVSSRPTPQDTGGPPAPTQEPQDPESEPLSGADPGTASTPPGPVGYDPFTSMGKLVSLYGGDKAAVLKAAQAIDPNVKSLPGIPPQLVMDLMKAKASA